MALQTKRGVTLLEILIALALLGGLAAIVAPALVARFDERAFVAAADVANEQLMMARAHAQATGEAVEVTYSPQTRRVEARVYVLASAETGPHAGSISGLPADDGAPPEEVRDAQALGHDPLRAVGLPRPSAGTPSPGETQSHPIPEGWASKVLAVGINLAKRLPAPPANNDESAAEFEELSATNQPSIEEQLLADLERNQEVRLAVFMSDGSALFGDDVWLNDANGRCGRIRINPWSGLPIFERLADGSPSSAAPTEQDDDADTVESDDNESQDAPNESAAHRHPNGAHDVGDQGFSAEEPF